MQPFGKRPDMVVHDEAPYNAESSRAALVEHNITPVDAFYVRNHGRVPELDRGRWRLRLDGLVSRPLTLSLQALQREFTARELEATLQCAGNRRAGLMAVRDIPGEAPWGPGATGTATWRGVALRDVLGAAGVEAEAAHIAFEGADVSAEAAPPQCFGGSIPRHKALADEVLLAWEMNGAPLPPVHGAPVRVVVPGYIGARSVKWLTRVVARREPSENFFQASAYQLLPPDVDPAGAPPGAGVALGAIAVGSDILRPNDGDRVAAGPVDVAGYAFAGDDRRIVRVDVSADGGQTWQQAELLDAPSPWAWRRWRTRLDLSPGPCELVARAWDSAAATQPENPAHLWNPKGYVNNAWARVAIDVRPR